MACSEHGLEREPWPPRVAIDGESRVSMLLHKGLTSARHGRGMRYSKAVPGLGPGRRLVALSKDMKLPAVLLVSSTQSYQLNSQPPRGDADLP